MSTTEFSVMPMVLPGPRKCSYIIGNTLVLKLPKRARAAANILAEPLDSGSGP